ncbi:MAG: hypothetical protein ACOX8Q_00025 [Christensenellales bacterium]
MDISIFELFFFLFIACAWPISIRRVVKNKSTKGKSLLFSCIVLLGYVFGIAHKFLFDLDYIVIVYFLNVTLVTVDTIVLLYTRHKYERKA